MASIGGPPRNRILRNLVSTIQGKTPSPIPAGLDDDEPRLTPLKSSGHVRLFSYYKPSLEAGEYTVTINHQISAEADGGHQELALKSEQDFEVYGERFTLPAGVVHQTYPPQGHGDLSNVLPHIAFNDAHLPWLRGAHHDTIPDTKSKESSKVVSKVLTSTEDPTEPPAGHSKTESPSQTPTAPKKQARNATPWLALLVFTEEELKLTQQELISLGEGQLLPNGQMGTNPFAKPTGPKVETPNETPGRGAPGGEQGTESDTFPSQPTVLEQSHTTMDISMTLGNVFNLPNVPNIQSPVEDDKKDPADPKQVVKMIFPKGHLFTALFCSYDKDWKRTLLDSDGKPLAAGAKTMPDLSRYKYLAHVKQVSHAKMTETANVANNGEAGLGEDEGVYSIIVSHRPGPLDSPVRSIETPQKDDEKRGEMKTLPKSGVVHLISLEGLEKNIKLPFSDPTATRVALVSLYSWTYTVLPPLSANFLDAMKLIGNQIPKSCLLRASDLAIEAMTNSNKVKNSTATTNITQRLKSRMKDGYSLVRYIPRTGEQSAAFCRGPLSPTMPNPPDADIWPIQSNFSTNLQIVDPALGIIDITYSTAWELGRTLAIADRAFTAALNRMRHSVNIFAINETKKELQGKDLLTKDKVFTHIEKSIRMVTGIPDKLQQPGNAPNPALRFRGGAGSRQKPIPASVRSQTNTRARFEHHVHAVMHQIASVKEDDGSAGLLPFNEVAVPMSPDWAIMLKWIMDKLHLYNIPAHFLVSDPAYLPRESIRFFHVDPNWMDALIDGTLSVGNHLENKNDVARQAFKAQINRYLSTFMDADKHKFCPQVPTFGFFLRSTVVEAYPNLEVHAPFHPDPNAPWSPRNGNTDTRVEVLRHDLLDKDIMFCLFDRKPGDIDFKHIVICQPPHQQRYAVENLRPGELDFQFRRVYTTTELPETGAYDPLDTVFWTDGQSARSGRPLTTANPNTIFDWDANLLVIPAFSTACLNVLSLMPTGKFVDTEPSSALVGFQLMDPARYLLIEMPQPTSTNAPGPRQIYGPELPKTAVQPFFQQEQVSTIRETVTPFQPNVPLRVPRLQIPPPLPAVPVSNDPPPNITKKLPAPKGSGTSGSSNAFPGQFLAAAFELGRAKADDKSFRISRNQDKNLPIDLVFGFVPVLDQIKNRQLHLFHVRIPMGEKDTDLLLTHDTQFGGGAKMLSNLRFNCHLSTLRNKVQVSSVVTVQGKPAVKQETIDQDWLVVSLVPRVKSQLVPLEKNPDLSFLLNEATLNNKPGKATCIAFESYANLVNDIWVDNGSAANEFSLTKVAID